MSGDSSEIPNPDRRLAHSRQPLLHEVVLRIATAVPTAAAVVGPETVWTYADLAARVTSTAAAIANSGARTDDVVAVYAERSPLLVSAVLAPLAAGCAFAVLDSGYPEARLVRSLRKCGAKAVVNIASPRAADALVRGLGVTVIDGTASPAMSIPPHAPSRRAYIAFSSGTTGVPHAIAGTHDAVSHFLRWQRERFGLRADDRFAMLSGVAHDPLLRDIFAPLSMGASLCVPDHKTWSTPSLARAWLAQQRVSVIHTTPPYVRALTAGSAPGELPALRYAFIGGDTLSWSDVERLRAMAPRVTCVNFYGATETPQAVAYYVVGERGVNFTTDVVPIGRGIDDVQILVLTARDGLARPGEIGEICVRSHYLAEGYVGDAELTRRRFVANPFTNDSHDRMYRTGDRGTYLTNGDVIVTGRDDRQVKIAGVRVELAEIETLLLAVPGVHEAVAIADPNPGALDALVVLVVADDGTEERTLRRALADGLPPSALPRRVLIVNGVPLTPNGKVDHEAVRRIATAQTERTVHRPLLEIERAVAAEWQELLGVPTVLAEDDFFDLGGDSLTALQFSLRLEEKLGVTIELAALYADPTLAAVAKHVAAIGSPQHNVEPTSSVRPQRAR